MPATKKNLTFSQLRVGVFVLIALAILALLILNATGDFNPFQKTITLKAKFANADGLRSGAEVQLAGVHIGKVQSVKFISEDKTKETNSAEKKEVIVAEMSVVKEIDGQPIENKIKQDSTAQLIATSVLGNDKMINITPGSKDSSGVSEGDVLKSSTAISINQLTSTGNDLLGQINKLAGPANQILDKANAGTGTLGQVINNPQLYDTLESTVGEAKIMILKMQTLAEQAKSGDGTAGKFLNDPALYNNLNQTVAKLESISDDIKSVSVGLKNGKGTAGKLFSDDALYTDARETIGEVKNAIADARKSIERLNKIADQVDGVAKDLNEGKGTAGKLLKDEAMYNDFRQTLAKINSTTERVDSILADAQSGKGTIGKLLTDDSLFNNINKVSGNVNQVSEEATKMIYDFRQNPKKYLTIKLKLF